MHLSVFIFAIALLITIISLLKPLTEKINFPYTVLLALIGILLGFAIQHNTGEGHGLAAELVGHIGQVNLTSKAIIFIFLPALIFESALNIEVNLLVKNLKPILILAIIGLVISTVIIGYSLNMEAKVGIIACLLIGAIASATDPVAVVAIFKSIGAPAKLNILVEGESLFNDGTAIVLFTILSSILIDHTAISFWSGLGFFLKTFIGGLVVGFVVGYIFIWIIGKVITQTTVIMTILITLPYLSFILAEHFCHVSGVLAVIANALVINSYGRSRIYPSTLHEVHSVWEELAFWANSLIFIFTGVLIPSLLANITASMYLSIVILIVSAFVARAIIIYIMLPILSRWKICESISGSYRTVMFWGALRGAVSLALALTLLENPNMQREMGQYITIVVTAFVLFTLFINATTVQAVLNWLGIQKLSESDQRLQVSRWSYIYQKTIDDASSPNTMALYGADNTANARNELVSEASTNTAENMLVADEMERVILLAILYQEREYYSHLFDDGYIDSEMAEFFRIHLNDCRDRIELEGSTGYKKAIDDMFKPTWFFKMAVYFQRYLHNSSYLQKGLATRFKCVFYFKSATQHLESHEHDEHISLGKEDEVKGFLDKVFNIRKTAFDDIHRDLILQYPEFTKKTEGRFYKIFIKLTELKYLKRLMSNGGISPRVYATMLSQIEEGMKALEKPPTLDLGLDPYEMIRKVDIFSELSDEQSQLLAKHVRPRLVIPGEAICKKGDKSNSMFFISSGVLRVCLEADDVFLSNGQFFGEIALLTGQPRTADVLSDTYSNLLVLDKKNFELALKDSPDIISHIRQVAEERLESHK
jgi:CPA1 family monovalent cation:H+ antiporter